MSNSTAIDNLYKSRVTILEMLQDQGYDTSDYDSFSISDIHAMTVNKQMDMLVETTEESQKSKQNNFQISYKDDKKESDKQPVVNKKVFVKYHLVKLRPPHVHEYIEDIFNVEEILGKDDTLIIIIKEQPNDTLINLVKHIWENDGVFIIIHDINNLLFNPLKHVLVPPHRILSEEEVKVIKEQYNIRENSEFNEISRFDPAAKAIGIRPGEVCEIIRSSKTALRSVNYRLCY